MRRHESTNAKKNTSSPTSTRSTALASWSKADNGYTCAGCGYQSGRKSNVERHFRRIHCLLKKPKICVCDKTFATKGEFYEHCDKVHPHLRHSSYVSTEVYKIGKLQSKAVRSSKDSVRTLRSSQRLSQLSEGEPQDDSSVEKLPSEASNAENLENNPPNTNVNSMSSKQVPVYNLTLNLADLPLKKRFGNYPAKRCLSDVTNFNNDDAYTKVHVKDDTIKIVNENLNNNEVKFNDRYLAEIDVQQRAFMSQIDFDELDAILNLNYLKKSTY